ncbi:hypothetical protein EW145_g6167 [Phellinidium pouzarii]|uniref:Uncharacterized protein n=1 Tax=Phellinidium pouzarii TaxID=167371 RepID=A0A4S4L281_9AGAM|nr:hypothetical protein EW145_g6167 [Phellinidium pouzarii]
MFSAAYSSRTELKLWAILAIVFAVWSSVLLFCQREASQEQAHFTLDYSWVGDDYPTQYPMTLETVLLTPEDTTHYKLYAADGPLEWEAQFPPGGGLVRLGPHNRTFDITMFRELRCLGHIRHAISVQSVGVDAVRLQKCFNLLREMALCRADVTLEDVLDAQHSVNHMYTHVCRDWTAVYEEAKTNHEQYQLPP